MPSNDSLNVYVRKYPRLCAAIIAATGHDATLAGAAFLLRDAHERPIYDPCVRDWLVPTKQRSLVARAYHHRHTLDGYEQTLARVRATMRAVPVRKNGISLDVVAVGDQDVLPVRDLGLAFLMVEAEEHGYGPVSAVSNLAEAVEVAINDLDRRMEELEHGGSPLCPYRYTLWDRDHEGNYQEHARLNISTGGR